MKGVPGFQTSTQSLLVHMGQISLMLSPHLLDLLTSIEELISELPISRATIQRGMTDFWLTLNPSGFRNLLVLQLAGIEIAADAIDTFGCGPRRLCDISPVYQILLLWPKFSIISVKPFSQIGFVLAVIYLASLVTSLRTMASSRPTVEGCSISAV
jgi:hypothetical protein